jgi:hypothetical protein
MKKHAKTGGHQTAVINPVDTNLTILKNPKAELFERGKKLREKCPRATQGIFTPAQNRPSAIDMLLESEKGRIEKLLPMRHGRMAVSPFTFTGALPTIWPMIFPPLQTAASLCRPAVMHT